MNIFYLHNNPRTAAAMHCDKHVVKMILETAQLLCGVYHHYNIIPNKVPYKHTHKNHPCSIWARTNTANFIWLCMLGMTLCREYRKRYGREHKSEKVIKWCYDNTNVLFYNSGIEYDSYITPPAQAMPEKYKSYSPIIAYRNYYMGEKSHFATWNKGTNKPEWYKVPSK